MLFFVVFYFSFSCLISSAAVAGEIETASHAQPTRLVISVIDLSGRPTLYALMVPSVKVSPVRDRSTAVPNSWPVSGTPPESERKMQGSSVFRR